MNKTGHFLIIGATGAALLVGVPGAATARPSHNPGKIKPAVGSVQLRQVGIHRHSAINVNAAATPRDLVVRAQVWSTAPAAAPTVTVTLAQFDRPRGTQVEPPAVADMSFVLTKSDGMAKRVSRYSGTVTSAALKAAAGVAPGARAWLCLASADLTASSEVTVRGDARQVRNKENGRDCVRVVNVDPTTQRAQGD